ncbi:helicase-exonuclease AddAB subunit AddA [Alkalicoccus halolimnae]|uniref:ATP-dependent helicase/nuclease subunit A n=1 Tax=Alkalicoccus halolimnae TaxID=1667239 RepID=A0A5C7FAN0_9BACI|nr:helicase-exonuclease AddAB subunit AddA [Alkalicoccus halolimnae]TXF87193.1 helicase-exonuclease AddAB subunit AddA [Alkalicoccus halolimnae]
MEWIPKPEGVFWTDSQWEALAREEKPLLVAAAAGSGKTAVLVERIIRKITDEETAVDLNRLLVVTFTNAAAAEMKQRVGKAIEKKITEQPASSHLRRQLSLLQRADISTLHSFCMQVIRTYYYEVDVDPHFRMLDETEAQLLEEEVMEEMFETAYAEDKQFYMLVDYFTGDRTDEQLKKLILDLYHFSRSHPNPSAWLDSILEIYNNADQTSFNSLSWVKEAKSYITDSLKSAEAEYNRALAAARAPGGPYKYVELLEEEYAKIIKASAQGDWEDLYSCMQEITFKKMPSIKKADTDIDSAQKEHVKLIRDKIKKQINELFTVYFSASPALIIDDMKSMAPVIQLLNKYVKNFSEQNQLAKLEKNALHFSDLEHYCLNILSLKGNYSNPSNVALQYQAQLQEVLIDEYQDTNFVQEAILMLLSGRKNLFMVGDVKQSIYRFRLAEPGLFLNKYKNYGKEEGVRIDLSQNFRSRGVIINSVNYIFNQIMSESLGELDYDEAASLKQGNFSFPENDDKSSKIILVDPEKDKVYEEGEDELETSQLEARATAQEIRRMIDRKFSVYDKETNASRPVKYRDIVILMRSMPWAETIIEECKNAEIPIFADSSTGYFEAVEVKVMLSLLQIIDNPYQDIPLASVLRSPIFSYTEDELTEIRLFAEEADFYSALKEAAAADYLSTSDVVQKISSWRDAVKTKGLSEFVWQLFEETGYIEYVGGMPGGKQRQANLRSLYDRARTYEQTSFRGLFRFLRFIERMRERGDDLGKARAIGEQEDVVRLMTIHKSKGLEFPIVIIAGLNKQFNMMDLNNSYLKHKDMGLAARFIDPENRVSYPTMYFYVVKEKLRREMLAEEMRILYVAMTRAEEKLIMTGTVKDFDSAINGWASHLGENGVPEEVRSRAKTYFDWIMPALFNHPDAAETLTSAGVQPIKTDEDDSSWSIERIQASELISSAPAAVHQKQELLDKVVSGQAAGEDTSYVDRKFSWKYPHRKATVTEVKKSVTELKRFEEDAYSDRSWAPKEPSFQRPAFIQTTSQSSAEIGTIMHAVLQYIDYQASSEKEIDMELGKMLAKELLTTEEADQVDKKQLLDFLNSETGNHLKNALWIEREVPFTYSVPASRFYPDWEGEEEFLFVQGIVDCVYKSQDRSLHILDYKTDKITGKFKDHTKAAESVRERYHFQLSLYREALESAWDTQIQSCGLYLLEGRFYAGI